MLLADKQTYISKEQNRELSNKLRYIHGQVIFDKGTKNSFLNIVVKIGETQAKEWNWNPPTYHSEKLTPCQNARKN